MEFYNSFLKITKNETKKSPLSYIWESLDLDLVQNEEFLFIIYTFASSTHFLEFTKGVCCKYRCSLILLSF